jgi:iron complex transport system ATP-binding protein
VKTILEVEGLHFGFGKSKVLKGVNFSLEGGEALCVFGPNGCGKSTMLECLLGMNKPNAGRIAFDGEDSRRIKIRELAQKVAFVPQKSMHTFGFTVFQMVLMGRTAGTGMFSSPDKKDEEIALQSLQRVGMLGFKDRIFNSLSGGESQLVRLARALAQQTKLIIVDEPTSHLDFRHELNVVKYMAALVRDEGISLIMSTHFPNHALFLENHGVKTRVAMMENGVFCASGKASEVLNEANMARIFKIKTKVYQSVESGRPMTHIMPVDFSDGGQWNDGGHSNKEENNEKI